MFGYPFGVAYLYCMEISDTTIIIERSVFQNNLKKSINQTIKTMKTKQYLNVVVTDKNGRHFTNPLKLSEAYLISRIAKENKVLTVQVTECPASAYKLIFG